jgi:tetratricopeptide (TPR) repeat protein
MPRPGRHGHGVLGAADLAEAPSCAELIDQAALLDPAARARFRREAEITAALDHAHIVPVFALGEIDGQPFLAMKRLSGPSLADLRPAQSPLAAARLGIALARALDSAHVHGVVHRDIKPQNVILDGDTPYVVDFGLARTQSDTTLTQVGRVPGTLRYLAPERLDGRNAVATDPRVDVYGLGATLYEIVAGASPYPEESPTALLRAILTREPKALRLRGRDRDFETIVLKAMAKSPAKRYATAAEFADDLERFVAGRPITARRIGAAGRLLRLVRRHRVAAASLTLAFLIAVGAFLLQLWTRTRTARDVAQRLTHADVLAARGDWQPAVRDLELLLAVANDQQGVRTRLAQARAEAALEELVLHVVNRTSNLASPRLTELRHVVRQTQWPHERRRVADLVVVAATAHVEGAAPALALLAQSSDRGRTRTAMEQWLRRWQQPGVAEWSTLPPHDTPAVIELSALTLVAMCACGRGHDELVQELEPWTRQPPVPRLLRYLHALCLLDVGAHSAATHVLHGLIGEQYAASHVWTALANVCLRRGQFAAARSALERVIEPTPSASYLALQLAYHESAAAGDDAPLRARLAELMRNSPSGEVRRFAAEWRGRSDRAQVESALTELAGVVQEAAHDVFGREFALEAMLALRACRLPPVASTSPEDLAAQRAFVAEHSKQVAEMVVPSAQARIRALVARARCAGATAAHSRCADAAELYAGLCEFADLMRHQIWHAPTIIDFGEAVQRHIGAPFAAQFGQVARDAVRGLIERHDAVEQVLVGDELGQAMLLAWFFADWFDDAADVVHWCARLEPMLDEEGRAQARHAAEEARAELARVRPPAAGK